jgi:hypothetical protein
VSKAGWYVTQNYPSIERYWDGRRWTEQQECSSGVSQVVQRWIPFLSRNPVRRTRRLPDPRKTKVSPLLPKKDERGDWLLDRGAFCFFWILLLLCPFWWLIDRREPVPPTKQEEKEWNRRRALWVVGWLVGLLGIWLINPAPIGWKVAFALLAGVRLLEVFTSGLGTVLKQTQQARARSLVTIGIYAAQLTLIFAILYHSVATEHFVKDPSGPTSPPAHATAAPDYLYISWSDLTTHNNNTYSPDGDIARLLQVSATTSGVLLLGVLLAYGINAVNEEANGEGEPDSGKRG